MSQPACDGQYVTFLASVKDTTGPAMQEALTKNFPGASYLRTDQSCPSINMGASDGTPLYRIFVGPFPDVAGACAARAQSTQGSFVKRLTTTDSPTHVVTCP
jgi:serine/threonine-protein kinase